MDALFELLNTLFGGSTLGSAIRLSIPLIFCAMAGVWSERSGIVDIGLEGKLLISAFVAAVVSYETGFALWGLLAAMAVSVGFSMVHGLATITFRGDHVISGLAINFLALGLTKTLGHAIYAKGGDTPQVTDWGRWTSLLPDSWIVAIRDSGAIGDFFYQVLLRHDLLVYLAFAAVPICAWFLYKSRFGLRVRAVGEYPAAVDTAGANVFGYRYSAVIIAGALCAFGGAYLSTSTIANFTHNMSAGMGYLALAAVIFGKWRPVGAMVGCLLFGYAFALKDRFASQQDGLFSWIPAQLFDALPYIVVVVVLAGVVGAAVAPKAIGRPYLKERE